MEKNAKIYVAWHTGLVGSAIVNELQSRWYTNVITRTKPELDLFDSEAVSKFFENESPDYVIDSAAKVGGIKANMTHKADFLYENLLIQNNLIWTANKHNVGKFLFLWSSCIYPRNSPQPMKEEYFMDWKVEPTNEWYAIAKIAWMKMCEAIYEQFWKKFISCMPTNIYGPRDNFGSEASHVIPALISRMHEAKIQSLDEVVIWGTWESKREFLYVEDLASACVWLMENYEGKEFVNIWTGIDVSIKELAFLIKDVVGFTWHLTFDATKPDGMPRKLLDVTKATNLWWKHSVSLEEGIRKTYEWYKENRVV